MTPEDGWWMDHGSTSSMSKEMSNSNRLNNNRLDPMIQKEMMERSLTSNPSSDNNNDNDDGDDDGDPRDYPSYQILSSSLLLDRLQSLVDRYPQFATLTTTQEWFGLPRAGGKNDCTFDSNYPGLADGVGCNNYVLIIQDKEMFPDDVDVGISEKSGRMADGDLYADLEGGWFRDAEDGAARSGWKYVPDVFLSGSVHGNERVGPTALIEMAELLLESAYCESLPRGRLRFRPEHDEDANDGNVDHGSGKDVESSSKNSGVDGILTSNTGIVNTNTNGTNDNDRDRDAQSLLWNQQLTLSRTCRTHLQRTLHITPSHRQWLARLVSHRRTIIIPTANALGYSRDEREEEGVDPNRDFPFDIPEGENGECMKTIAGRSINELWRSHLFGVGLTFHGGTEVIGYEWGAPTYLRKDAPDSLAQDTIASAYSRYANAFPSHVAYDFGTMNDKVYYVRGGMEDWAFAGSWDPERVVECRPLTYADGKNGGGGYYPPEKTRYNNSTLRAFNMLIETSNIKDPPEGSLGRKYRPLESSKGVENGHVARNIRLALVAMDVVEPYVAIEGVEGMILEDGDVIPGVNWRRYDGGSFFENSRMVWVPGSDARTRLRSRWLSLLSANDHQDDNENGEESKRDENDVLMMKQHTRSMTSTNYKKIAWTVGGAFDIDTTELIYGPWELLPENLANEHDGFYPSIEALEILNSNEFKTVSPSNVDVTSSIQGRSRWHAQGPFPTSDNEDDDPFNPINPSFEADIDISSYASNTELAIFARAKVDSAWLSQSSNVGPDNSQFASGMKNGPASHIVNARTNPNYYSLNAGKIIKGRDGNWWYSPPITLLIGGNDASGEEQVLAEATTNHAPMSRDPSNGKVKAIHVNARLGGTPILMGTVSGPKKKAVAASKDTMPWLLGVLGFLTLLSIVVVVVIRRRRGKYVHRQRVLEQVAEFGEDDEEDDSLAVGVETSKNGSYHDDVGDGGGVVGYGDDVDGDEEFSARGKFSID